MRRTSGIELRQFSSCPLTYRRSVGFTRSRKCPFTTLSLSGMVTHAKVGRRDSKLPSASRCKQGQLPISRRPYVRLNVPGRKDGCSAQGRADRDRCGGAAIAVHLTVQQRTPSQFCVIQSPISALEIDSAFAGRLRLPSRVPALSMVGSNHLALPHCRKARQWRDGWRLADGCEISQKSERVSTYEQAHHWGNSTLASASNDCMLRSEGEKLGRAVMG